MVRNIRTLDLRCLVSTCKIPANSLYNLRSHGDLSPGGSRAPSRTCSPLHRVTPGCSALRQGYRSARQQGTLEPIRLGQPPSYPLASSPVRGGQAMSGVAMALRWVCGRVVVSTQSPLKRAFLPGPTYATIRAVHGMVL